MDFLTNPFIVGLLFLYQIAGGSLVLAIVIFTILSRMITFPLTYQQLKSSKKMQEVGPKLQALREKYKGDREKLAQAQMALYKENGVNPFAGCLPLLIQMPILFGLYGAIYAALGNTPLQLLDLQHRLLIPSLSSLVPLNNQFLWMNLGMPDPYFVLPVLVTASTWLQSKLMTPTPADPKDPSAAMARNMTVMMPIMIGLFSLSFASGLSIYWIVSNVVGIVQYALMGKIDFGRLLGRAPAAVPAAPLIEPADMPKKKGISAESKPVSKSAKSGGTGAPKSGMNRKQSASAPKASGARKPSKAK